MALALLFTCDMAGAATVDLYRDELPVVDQSLATRRPAFALALQHVLLRLSGSAPDLTSPPIAAAVQQAQRYVQRFEYRAVTPKQGEQDSTGSLLDVRFDPKAIDALAQRAGLPAWSAQRPDLVVWLALDDGQGRRLVSESDRSLVHAFIDRAKLRGLPVLFPLLDLEEQQAISVAEVWGGYTQRLIALSRRYGAQGVLVGRIFPVPHGQWSVRWDLSEGGRPDYWSMIVRGDLDAALEQAADRAADAMAQRYAVREINQPQGRYHLLVDGVTQLSEMSAVQAYLDGLSAVSNTMPVRLHGNTIEYALDLTGSVEQLVNVLSFSDVLEPADVAFVDMNGVLHARLRP